VAPGILSGGVIKDFVKSMIGRPSHLVGHPDREAAGPQIQARDTDQAGGDRFPACTQIGEAIADQAIADQAIADQAIADQATAEHGGHILAIPGMIPFNFCESLPVKVVMKEGDLSISVNQGASILPAGKRRDEEVGRGRFDVDLERFFELRQTLETSERLRIGFQIDVQSHLAPAHQDCRNAARKVDATLRANRLARFFHKSFDAGNRRAASHRPAYPKTCGIAA